MGIRGLFACWRSISPQILFDALLILPLRAEWLRCPNAHNHCFRDLLRDTAFVTLLRWKDTQGLLFLMLSDDQSDDSDPNRNSTKTKLSASLRHRLCSQHSVDSHIVDPFWLTLSERLQRLWDPTTQRAYAPLRVDAHWWRCALSSASQSRFGVSARDVLNELRFVTLKFAAIREILFRANPSLETVIAFSDDEFADQNLTIAPRRSILDAAHMTAALSIGSLDSEVDGEVDLNAQHRRDRPRLSLIEIDGLDGVALSSLSPRGSDSNLEELALNERVHEDDTESEDDGEEAEAKQFEASSSPADSADSDSLETSETTNSNSNTAMAMTTANMAKNVSVDSVQSAMSLVDCTMDWWLCPEYYYNTPAAKFDSDDDSE